MPAVAGPRVHWVSVITIGCLAAFVAGVLVLVAVDVAYTSPEAMRQVLESPEIRHAIRLSLITTTITLFLVAAVSIPVGYALSRYRFPGAAVIDTLVDLPIVLPPVVIGVSLLVFFQTAVGR
jgi:molybdate transport system permease protein